MKSSMKNKFSWPPLVQLQQSLGPTHSKQAFEKMKDLLFKLGSDKLDLNLTTRQQPEALLNIEARLIDKFPDIFSGRYHREKLSYARQAVVRRHCERRSAEGYSTKRRKKANKENRNGIVLDDDIIDLTMLDSDSDKETARPMPSASRIKPHVHTPQSPRTRGQWRLSTLTYQGGNLSLVSAPAQKPTGVLSSSVSCPPLRSQGQSRPKGFNHIHIFLKSCSPSLEHLLSRFVDLGFKSPEILKEVACHWSQDERLELLKKLQGPHAGEVSELELIALERRFQKYSLEV